MIATTKHRNLRPASRRAATCTWPLVLGLAAASCGSNTAPKEEASVDVVDDDDSLIAQNGVEERRVPPPPPRVRPTTVGNWSDPATWGGRKPVAGETVTIPRNVVVVLDESPPALGGLRIDGDLEFARRDLDLTAEYILVHGGVYVGTREAPFAHRATITLTGPRHQNIMGMGSRGILVMDGRVELYGVTPNVAWTRLADHADAGARTLALAQRVNWRASDQLALAPTDFYDPNASTELVEANTVGGDRVELRTGIRHFRWGKLQHVTRTGMSLTPDPEFRPPSPGSPTVLDERAEVANLTRRIRVVGADDELFRRDGFGAHVMVMGRRSVFRLDGVELRRVGQSGLLGRYPIHFHMLSYDAATGRDLGDVTHHVRNTSVWESENRCMVIHGTNGVTLQRNVCFDIKGHAYFFEDAVERRNHLENNIALKVRQPRPGVTLLAHERPTFQRGPTGYWLTNPDNVIRGNVGADTDGNGFWLAYPRRPLGLSRNVPIRPEHLRFGVFDDNTAHTNRAPGINLDWVPIDDAGNVQANRYMPTADGEPGYGRTLRAALRRITTYKNNDGGLWNRIWAPDYEQWVSADNVGKFFAGSGEDGKISRSLVVGTSLNRRAPYPSEQPPVASASYHSQYDFFNNTVVNFPFVDGKVSGAFAADDYYIRPVDLGTIRMPNNLLIASSPGWRMPPVLHENWTLAGALWDPHGYHGPRENFWVYDDPFLTAGRRCVVVAPAGKNGRSCEGPYYGVTSIETSGRVTYQSRVPLDVTREDERGQALGRWTVGDGNLAPKLGNMRHFAAVPRGRYVVRFPGIAVPRDVGFRVENAYRPGDEFVVAIPFDRGVQPRVYMTSRESYFDAGPSEIALLREASSKDEVLRAPDAAFFRDVQGQLVWIKLRVASVAPSADADPKSDQTLYRRVYVRIHAR
jgi:hypothetical protein